ncbi:MAG: tetratricopeptide repeat protein [Thermodesulfobacteriota bacterium]
MTAPDRLAISPAPLETIAAKMRPYSRLLLTAAITALLAVPAGSSHAENPPSEIETASVQRDVYDFERAEFLYRTGDYLGASISLGRILRRSPDFPGRDRVVVLKWLSDLSVGYREDPLPTFSSASMETVPGLARIFENLYRQGEYPTLASLSEGVEGGIGNYLGALSLYQETRFDEALELLSTVPDTSPALPYAKFMLAQILTIKGDLPEAERHLEELISLGVTEPEDMLNRARLSLGYLLFEGGRFSRADESFRTVDRRSRFHKPALMGSAWARVKLGRYKKALSTIGRLKPLSPSNRAVLELMLAETYCLYKTGKFQEARAALAEALAGIRTMGEGLRLIYAEGVPAEALHLIAMGREEDLLSEPDAAEGPVGVEGAFAVVDAVALLGSNPELNAARADYRAFETITGIFEKKGEAVYALIEEIEKNIAAQRENLADATRRTKFIRRLLILLASKVLDETSEAPVIRKGGDHLPAIEAGIAARWEKRLNRRLTGLEKDIVHMTALDGQSGIWYLNNTVYCQFVFWMATDLTKYEPGGGYGEGILERMVLDLKTVAAGGEIPYEKLLPELELAVLKRIEEEYALLERLEDLGDRVEESRKKAERGMEEALGLIGDVVSRRAGMMSYEMTLLERKALAALKDIEAEEKRSKKK